jgi:hypothetical protein
MRWKMRELREIRWKRELENRSTKKMRELCDEEEVVVGERH